VQTHNLQLHQTQLKNPYHMLHNKTPHPLQQTYHTIKLYQQNINLKHQSSQQTQSYQPYHPIQPVPIYLPPPKPTYPSTLLMTPTLPQLARVNHITLLTPPQNNPISQELLPPSDITPLHRVYQVAP
ncbi:histidinol dehydrogenase, partial [Staphylococcus epidermidis]|uniref:histidinol dehydrogenase n=1 Tax=Staphylococcus epidermidis TaxID=1282 RepID=UPI001642903B